ncbi:alpha/beta hydrolase family protein [Paenibacillus hamazuiensis]|uniref:alpha/beta hydrolase family protein n=1 Tax=Paenibacillus hamazuiensis TaxID=2936508 RepID=UPI0020102271|nr:alpha/beta hydrolase [Paenibacillus hamazuiensis]
MPSSVKLDLGENRVIRASVFHVNTEARGTLIISHGFKGFKDWGFFPYAAEQLSEFLDVISFNFSHNGVGDDLQQFTELEKFAQNTYSLEVEDLAAVVRAVKSKAIGDVSVHGNPIFLLGHSKGAGTSLIYALDHPGETAGVISWNGIADVNIFSAENVEEMRSRGRSYTLNGRTKQQMPLDRVILDDIAQNRERFDLLRRIGTIDVPVALIQGTEDHDRLRKGSAKLLAANPSIRYVAVEGGNHTFNAVHPFAGTTESLDQAIAETKRFILTVLDK